MDAQPLRDVLPLNPFLRQENKSIREKFKQLLVSITLFPIRCISFLGIIGFQNIYARLVMLAHDRSKPIGYWRTLFLQPLRYLTRLMLFMCGFYWIKVKGTPSGKEIAPIVVGNHVSTWEGFYISYYLMTSPIVRGENQSDPFFAPVFEAAQSIFVDRHSSDSRKDTLAEIDRRSKIPEYPQLLLFPEATCTNGKSLISFKNGAFTPGLPVQPFIVRYPFSHLDHTFTGGLSMISLLVQSMCQFVNYMEIEYLDVYYPSDAEKKDPSLYAKNVRRLMAQKLNGPVTDHSLDDAKLYEEALKTRDSFHIPFIVSHLVRDHDLQNRKVNFNQLMRVFTKFDLDKDSALNGGEFGVAVSTFSKIISGLDRKDRLNRLFSIFGGNPKGFIDFKDFVLGMSLSNNKQDQIRLAFEICDSDGDGLISPSDLAHNINTSASMAASMKRDSSKSTESFLRVLSRSKIAPLSLDDFKSICDTDPDLIPSIASLISQSLDQFEEFIKF